MERSKKHFVPWFNSSEWFTVFELIYGKESNDESRQKALTILKVWKSRTQLLQSGAEGTLIILGALLVDPNMDHHNKRIIQSTSIMRFLNICAANDKRQGTFYQTAKKRKIPEWIISLRHDVAHSQTLPMSDILILALNFCLQWLYTNYWLLVSKNLSDHVEKYDANIVEYDELKYEIEPYVTNFLYLNFSTHEKWGYFTFADISDKSIREAIKNDLKLLLDLEDVYDNTKLSEILHLLWLKMERKFNSKNTKNKSFIIPQLLVESEIFLGNADVLKEFDTLPHNFIILWEKLLRNLHTLGMIDELLETLLDIVYSGHESNLRKKCSAFWLNELGKAFNKCIMAQNLYQKLISTIKNKKSTKQLNLKLKAECEKINPELKDVLTLDLISNIPKVFLNAELFKKQIMREVNEYTSLFMPVFLEICEEFKNEKVKDKILKLNDSFTNIHESVPVERIYTVEDLINAKQGISELETNGNDETMDVDSDENDIWKRITDIDFEKCPIGVLPWQNTVTNTLLNFC